MNVGKDLTETFQGLVFARRKVNGQMSSIASSNGDISSSSPSSDVEGTKKHPILGTKKQSPFMVSCKMVFNLLSDLESFLKSNRLAYLQTSKASTVATGVPPMSEAERRKVDEQAETSLKQCDNTITQLQAKLTEQAEGGETAQILEHRSHVLLHLLDVYGEVSTFYFNLKSSLLEMSRESRTGYTNNHEAILSARRFTTNAPRDSSPPHRSQSPSSMSSKSKASHTSSRRGENNALNGTSNESEFQRSLTHEDLFDTSSHRGTVVNDQLDDLDIQVQEQLRRENLALQTSLSSMSDDIRQVEQQMVVLSQAQQLIARNLMEHRDDLEHIHRNAKDATHHISKGNYELEKAAQSSSTFRLIVLLIILAASFLLLLLHHFEP